jgi:hypothetical protein
MFRAQVLDRNGCLLGNQPAWRISQGAGAVNVSSNGNVDIKPDAAEGEVKLTANVGGQSVEVIILVVPQERYEALLAQRGFNEAGESDDAAAATIASGSIGAKSVVSRAGGSSRPIVIAIIGVSALVIGMLGLYVVQRRRRRAPPRGSAELDAAAPTTGLARRCPTCGRDFFGNEQFCTEDATALVPAAAAQMTSSIPPPVAKICPVCATQYPGVAEFCGKDGSTLVPVN